MVDLSHYGPILVYLVYILTAWVILWSVSYKVFGVYLGSISINNGILFNNLQIHLRSIQLNFASIRFRLWGNSQKLIISGLQIVIIPTEKDTNNDAEYHDNIIGPTSSQGSVNNENLKNDDPIEDPESSIPNLKLFSSNSILRWFTRLLICHLPNIDIELKRTLVEYKDHITKAEFIRINSLSRYSNQNPNNLKFKLEAICNYFETSSRHHNDHKFPLLSIDSNKFDFKFAIDLTNGEMHTIKLKLFTDDLKLLVFKLTKLYKTQIESKLSNYSNKPSGPSRVSAATKSEKPAFGERLGSGKVEHFLTKLNSFYRKIDEVSILAENINVLEIPFLTNKFNDSFTDFLSNQFPVTSLELLVKSASFNVLKMTKDSAGFHALFDSIDDLPMFFSHSMQLLTINFSTLHFNNDLISKQNTEVLNLPNYSVNFKGNFLDKFTKNEGFKDCVAEIFFTCSNPILDLDSSIIASIIYNIVISKKYMHFTKVYQHYLDLINENLSESDDSQDELDETLIDSDGSNDNNSFRDQEPSSNFTSKISKTPLKDKLWKFLQEYYPRLDFKLIIEQPRIIISHSNKLSSKLQILNFQYSSLNLQVVTTAARDYELKCQVLQPTINYIDKYQKSLANNKVRADVDSLKYSKRFEILAIRSVNTKISILKNFKFKIGFELNTLKGDLSDLTPLIGINLLLSEMIHLTESDLQEGFINTTLKSKLAKYERILSKTNIPEKFHQSSSFSSSRSKKRGFQIFNYLPYWFVELSVQFNALELTLGSKSVLIPNDELVKDFLNSSHNSSDSSSFNGVTSVKVRLDDFNYNVKNDLAGSLTGSVLAPASASSLGTLTPNNTYWKSEVNLHGFDISVDTDLDSISSYESLLTIPDISANISSHKLSNSINNNLEVSINLSKLDGNFSYSKLFILISSVHLLKENVITPLGQIKAKIKNDMHKSTNDIDSDGGKSGKTSIHHNNVDNDLLSQTAINFKLKKSDVLFVLHNNYKLKLDIYQTKLELVLKQVSVHNKFLRVLTESPSVTSLWCRLVCLDDLLMQISLSDKENIAINSSLMKFIHPHKHVTYKLFDNISITIKVLKHLLVALKSNDRILMGNGGGAVYGGKNKGEIDLTVVHPSESTPKKLPNIFVNSKRLLFQMEDDPFESELGFIYQLGKVEQRKRQELYSVFESKIVNSGSDAQELEENLYELHQLMSESWIRKIKTYKNSLNDEIVKNKKFLFGNEAKLDSSYQKNIQPYSIHAPLLSIILDDLNLHISSPKFDLAQLPKYMNEVGQGLPLDTKYSLNIPTHIDLKLKELRMHLRDYPLPLLYVPTNPNDPDSPAVKMNGHLVIAESLVTNKENIRVLQAELLKNCNDHKFDGYYKLAIEKTLASVKMYTDINVAFITSLPSRFVWGQSYQFGIQQVMLNFDQFSKPPVDPSRKLGFWDKLRLIMHGTFKIRCGEDLKPIRKKSTKKSDFGALEVAFKGSRDPYDVFQTSTGFILSFKDNVMWTINENDDSKQFCHVNADKVSWYIPNYLASTLVAWMRDSRKTTYMPDADKFITSCFAYYLEDETYSSPKNLKSFNVFEKKIISLSGGVDFKVGFVLQRDGVDERKTEDCKPHYQINLFNPKYTKAGHDSYEGFRSKYINMAISLHADFNASYNSIHLSPGVFKQFFQWWKLFDSNMQLPIRRGELFGGLKESTKFSQHLITNRFIFQFKSLFISHVYRDESVTDEDDFVQSYGLRGKMENFIVDAHQRKEERISVHEELSRNKRIKKMNFHIADVHLSGIDLRLLSAKFDQNLYEIHDPNKANSSKYKIFDDDLQWFDIEDYEEAFLPTLVNNRRVVQILPLLYSEWFSYLRDTDSNVRFNEPNLFNFTSDNLGHTKYMFDTAKGLIDSRIDYIKESIKFNKKNGKSIKPLIDRISTLKQTYNDMNRAEKSYLDENWRRSLATDLNSNFHNKFILVGMLLKWNNKNRNLFYKYTHFVTLKSFLRKYLSFESISTLEELIKNSSDICNNSQNEARVRKFSEVEPTDSSKKAPKHNNSQDRINDFDNILTGVSANEDVVEDYLLEILSPQIQLQSDETPDSTIIITSPKIGGKIVSVYDKSNDRLLLDIAELENRYGCIVENANVLVFDKLQSETSDTFLFDKRCYGSSSNWPPWLGIEICQDAALAGDDHLLLENTSVMVTFSQLKPFGANIARVENDENGGITGSNSTDTDNESTYFDTQVSNMPATIQQMLCVDIPKVVVTSTASQYYTLYCIIMDLLLYNEPNNEALHEKLEKLKLSMNLQDLSLLHQRIKQLHFQNRLLEFLSNNYNFRQNNLNNELLNEYLELKLLQGDIVNEIYLLMHSILAGNSNNGDSGKQPKAQWVINADEIILHMLEDNRSPILDIALAQGRFRRIVNEDESNINKVEVSMIEGFNLLDNATFPAFLEPLDHNRLLNIQNLKNQNFITVDWSMAKEVGGIKLVENFEVSSQPLSLRIDEITGQKLISYIFGGSDGNLFENNNNDIKTKTPNRSKSRVKIKNNNKDDNESTSIENNSNNYDSEESEDDDENFDTSSLVGFLDETQGANRVYKENTSMSETNSRNLRNGSKHSQLFGKLKSLPQSLTQSSESNGEYDKQVEEMVSRSKKYISVNSFKINKVLLLVSLKAKRGYKRLLNVEDFYLEFPELTIQRKILSPLEMAMLLKKIIIRAILGHLGGLVKNKFARHKKTP